MDIKWIQREVGSGEYEFSGHADDEREAEKLLIADVEEALLNGEILEDYPSDPRGQVAWCWATVAAAIPFT